jgi:hypothetical protein
MIVRPHPESERPLHGPLQNLQGFCEWAMLDLNQRPPPYKEGKGRL